MTNALEVLVTKLEEKNSFGKNEIGKIVLEIMADNNFSDAQSQVMKNFLKELQKTSYGKNELKALLLNVVIKEI